MKRFGKTPLYVLAALAILIALVLAGCDTPTPSAAPAPTQAPHLCTYVVADGDGMTTVMGKLGYDFYNDALPPVKVNGFVYNSPKNLSVNPKDVVSVVNGINCLPGYDKSTAQTFDDGLVNNYRGDWRSISGYQRNITADRVEGLAADSCKNVLWNVYSQHFNGDVYTGGCNFKTVIKTSMTDGTNSCQSYSTVSEAVTAIKGIANLSDMKYFAIAVLSKPDENSSTDLCR